MVEQTIGCKVIISEAPCLNSERASLLPAWIPASILTPSMSTAISTSSAPKSSWTASVKQDDDNLYGIDNATGLLPKAVLATALQTAYVMVFFVTLARIRVLSPKRRRTSGDVPIYVYLFVTHCSSWIYIVGRVWGSQSQIEAAMGLVKAPQLPNYIDCSSLFVIIGAADLLLLYRVYVVWRNYSWYLLPLPFWMLANWAFYIIDIQRALDLGEKYTVYSLVSSVCFDLVGTFLIAGRLMLHRNMVEVLGASHQRFYGRLAIVFVESSAITSASRLVFMAAFATAMVDAERWTQMIATYGSLFGSLLVIFRIINHSSKTHSAASGAVSTLTSGTEPASFKSSRDHDQPSASFLPNTVPIYITKSIHREPDFA